MLPALSEKEWKQNALLLALFFFFNMCASRSYCNTYFSSSKKPEQAVFAKERFYTFLLLCLTAERRHCGMKALVGGSCAQTLAPEVAVEL